VRPRAGEEIFHFWGNFSFFGEIFGVFLCEPLDLLLFKTGNFSNRFPRGRKFDRFAADSAPLGEGMGEGEGEGEGERVGEGVGDGEGKETTLTLTPTLTPPTTSPSHPPSPSPTLSPSPSPSPTPSTEQ